MKLTLILGSSWSFEVVSWLASSDNCQHWFWVVTDSYNALSAILIFLFFGLKESNVLLLEKKYRIFKGTMSSQRILDLSKPTKIAHQIQCFKMNCRFTVISILPKAIWNNCICSFYKFIASKFRRQSIIIQVRCNKSDLSDIDREKISSQQYVIIQSHSTHNDSISFKISVE